MDSLVLGVVRLWALVRRLRRGCPWDREQTLRSLGPLLLEEVSELSQAIEFGDRDRVAEEFGDLCFTVLFGLRILQEEVKIRPSLVLRRVREKLIRRHPHLFRGVRLSSSQEVLLSWERIKLGERAGAFRGPPSSLPGLKRAQSIQERAARVGLGGPEGPLGRLSKPLKELELAFRSGGKDISEGLGDIGFSLAGLARHLKLDAEALIHQACDRFEARMAKLSRRLEAQGKRLGEVDLSELNSLWEELEAEEDEEVGQPQE